MFVHSIGPRCATPLRSALALIAALRAAAAQQPSATALATAKELITAKGAGELYEPFVPGVIERAKSVLLQTNPMLGKDAERSRQPSCAPTMRRAPRELIDEVARLYAPRFTEQELKDALAFYKSPLGRSWSSEEPQHPRPEHEELPRPGPKVCRDEVIAKFAPR